MTEQEELQTLLLKLVAAKKGWGEFPLGGGDLVLWRWSNGALLLSAYVQEPPGSDRVDVLKINERGQVVGCASGMISWALDRVRKYMILECLADV